MEGGDSGLGLGMPDRVGRSRVRFGGALRRRIRKTEGRAVQRRRARRATQHGAPLDGLLPRAEHGANAVVARVHVGKPQIPRHPKNTYAAETPTTDGKRVYVLFGDVGLYCYDFDGQPLWSHEIEPKKSLLGYGAAASPIVQGDQVVMVYDNLEESYIAALDSATGQQLLENDSRRKKHLGHAGGVGARRHDRDRGQRQEGKPLVHHQRRVAVAFQWPHVEPHHPLAIRGRWLALHHLGLFSRQGPPGVRGEAGPRGDITLADDETSNAFIAWSLKQMGPYNTSPIVYRGLYYTLLDRGMMTCHDAKTGELVYDRTRFPQGASFTSSPWAYNGKLFCLDENGSTYVLTAGREFQVERTNVLDELCLSTLAICQGKLLIRTASRVYCIGQRAK